MRVVVVAPHFPEYAFHYAEALAGRAEVLLIADAGQFNDEFEGRFPSTHCSSVRLMKFKSPLDLFALLVTILRVWPEFVHFQEAVGPRRRLFNFVAGLFCKLFATIVLTVHDPVPHEGRDHKQDQRSRRLAIWLRELADVVVVHGEYCEHLYRSHHSVAHQRLIVSRHGVILQADRVHSSHSNPGEAGRHPRVARFLVFGRMESYKGLETLSRALDHTEMTEVEYELVVAGTGPELDRLEAAFTEYPSVTVHNRYIDPLSLMSELEMADCVVLPYTSATQSGVLAAAFGSGCFVVASNVGGLSDLVEDGENGLLVEAGDDHGLAQAISRVARDLELRRHLASGAAKTAETSLSWDLIADKIVAELGTFRSADLRRSQTVE
ncbi:glycosyltransferase family 4 protein [Actinomycetospora sp. TBRC 11914]|uniref:glycosyltransferase family 4 protein n=1 Tax=Actinomycetospora sp. TBRC 11914 TaxID=2729387 RepID=UPI00145E2F11|nr:glycosyltransferase family 4 protein [Actinomycetospora sp. TBRC 11914]NMO90333.1 glycosyltransferase family 4 protein [Actinomycetospora sp. TBRC 11914]